MPQKPGDYRPLVCFTTIAFTLQDSKVLAGGTCHLDAPVRTFGVRPALDLGVALAFVVGALQ